MFDSIINLTVDFGLPLLCLLSISLMVAHSSLFGMILVWAGYVWDGRWYGVEAPPALQLANGINIQAMDAIASILLTGFIIRLIQQKRFTKGGAFLAAFSFLAFISYVRGILVYGLQSTTNDFRVYYYVIAVAFYFSSIKVTVINFRNFQRVWFAGTAILVFFAMLKWIFSGISEIDNLWGGAIGFHFRVLPAKQTWVLAQTLLILILAPRKKENSNLVIVAMVVLAAMVVILQHRTVWVTLLFALALIVFKHPAQRHRIGVIIVGGGLIFLAIALMVLGPTLLESIDASVEESTSTQKSTFIWRIEKWEALLGDMDASDFLIGKPFGSPYVTKNRVGAQDISPHNYYIQTIFRLGLLGLLILILLWINVLRVLAKRKNLLETNFFNPSSISLLLSAQLIYMIPYGFNYIQATILGLGIALEKVNMNSSISDNKTKLYR